MTENRTRWKKSKQDWPMRSQHVEKQLHTSERPRTAENQKTGKTTYLFQTGSQEGRTSREKEKISARGTLLYRKEKKYVEQLSIGGAVAFQLRKRKKGDTTSCSVWGE